MLQSFFATPVTKPGTTAGTFAAGDDTRLIGVSVDSAQFGVVTGTVSSAQQAANVAGIQAAWAMATATGKALLFGPSTYQVSATLSFGGGTTGQVRLLGYPGKTTIQSSVTTACTFRGSISGSTLTVTTVQSGALCVGCNINTGSGWTTIEQANADGTWGITETMTVASTSMSAGAPIVLVGNGLSTNSLINGEVVGLSISGPTAAPTTGSTALMLAGLTQVHVRHVTCNNVTIGIDAVANCYGLTLSEVRAGFYGSARVGAHLRGVSPSNDPGAGNQITLSQAWLSGIEAGVMIGPGADGISIRDGQVGASGSNDAYGNIVLGKSYYPALAGGSAGIGGTGVVLVDGVDMEGFSSWAFRSFGEMVLAVRGSPIIVYDGTTAIGVAKFTNANNGSFSICNCTVRGKFSSPVAVSYAGYGGSSFTEDGTFINGDAVFAGVACPVQSVFAQSYPLGLSIGIARYHDFNLGDVIYCSGTLLRAGGTGLQVSTDRATFSNLLIGGVKPNSVAPLAGWFSADRVIPAPADGGLVSSWADISGAGGAATQATAASQPVYRSIRSSIPLPYSSAPVLHFNGTSHFFGLALSGSGALSAVVLASATDFTNSNATLIGPNDDGGVVFGLVNNGTQLMIGASNGLTIATVNVALTAGDFYVFGASYANPGAWSLTLNGAVIGSGVSTGTFTPSRTLQIGCEKTRNFWKGGIGEVAIYSAAKTASDLMKVSTWLMRKYGMF